MAIGNIMELKHPRHSKIVDLLSYSNAIGGHIESNNLDVDFCNHSVWNEVP